MRVVIVAALLGLAWSLTVGCNRASELAVDDAGTDSGTDSEDDDNCPYDCFYLAECLNWGGEVLNELTCPGSLICCYFGGDSDSDSDTDVDSDSDSDTDVDSDSDSDTDVDSDSDSDTDEDTDTDTEITFDMVVYYQFNSCDVTTPESMGTGLDAELVGDVACAADDSLSTALDSTWSSGTALSCSGSDAYAEAPDDELFEPDQFTFSAWIYSYGCLENGTCTIVSKANSDAVSNGYWLFVFGDDTDLFLTLNICADGAETSFGGGWPINAGTWHHVVATFDGLVATLYVDGVEDASEEVPDGITYGGETFKIGKMTNRPFDFNGLIEEVALWNYALSSDDVTSLYEFYIGG